MIQIVIVKPDGMRFQPVGTQFVPKKKLFQTLMMTSDWNREMGIDTVGDLNDQICQGNISDMILVQEALNRATASSAG